jgi:sugar lactone lactonase YvrE
MKPSSNRRSIALALLFGGFAFLSGCGGTDVALPDSVVANQVQGPPIQGNVYGGHAPITSSHIYVLQPSTSAYGGTATSILGNNGSTTTGGGAYTIHTNATDPNVPAGAKYITTDANGNWNITGGYTCAANQPVFLYSYGGASPSTQPPTTEKPGGTTLTSADISKIVVTNAVVDSSSGTATYAITTATTEALSAGEAVTIAGLTGNLAVINGAHTVLATPAPGATTFSITASDVYGSYTYFYFFGFGTYYDSVADGTYTATTGPAGVNGGGNDNGGGIALGGNNTTGTGPFGTGGTAAGQTASVVPTTSPIVELATLGLCPSSGTSGITGLSFVFMNEISTVATAYTFQPFTLPSNNSAWDIGSSGTTAALANINIATQNAAQLYDIQGSVQDSNSNGEGHIANAHTVNSAGKPNAGTGTVPQAEIDTLGNILAACLDSTPGTGGLISAQCSTLFNTATDHGSTVASGDTAPTDIATAAINIARYPDGNHSGTPDPSYATDLYGIPSTTVPFSPVLTSPPNDWSIVLSFTGGGISPTVGTSPHSVAIDGSGNVYMADYGTSKFSKFSPQGIASSTTGYGTGLNGPLSIAVDSTSANVWMANFGGASVSKCTVAGTCGTAIALGKTGPQDAALDGSGNVWVTTGTESALVEVTGTAVVNTITSGVSAPNGLAIEQGTAGAIWVADQNENDASQCTSLRTGVTCTAYSVGGVHAPVGVAIDQVGDIWLANSTNGTVTAITNGALGVAGSPFTTGASTVDAVAIDGGNNVWVTSSNGFALYELTHAGGVISPAVGYTSTTNTEPDGIAIDGSGNIWYDSATNAALYEVIGAALPVVTPIAKGVTAGTLATKP